MLDDILREWHRWASGWSGVAAYGSCAVFAGYRSPRQWDDEGEIADASIRDAKMRAVDFHVSELAPLHRTALQIQARNLSTGHDTWLSVRLPSDLDARVRVVRDARNLLARRLTNAGIM